MSCRWCSPDGGARPQPAVEGDGSCVDRRDVGHAWPTASLVVVGGVGGSPAGIFLDHENSDRCRTTECSGPAGQHGPAGAASANSIRPKAAVASSTSGTSARWQISAAAMKGCSVPTSWLATWMHAAAVPAVAHLQRSTGPGRHGLHDRLPPLHETRLRLPLPVPTSDRWPS